MSEAADAAEMEQDRLRSEQLKLKHSLRSQKRALLQEAIEDLDDAELAEGLASLDVDDAAALPTPAPAAAAAAATPKAADGSLNKSTGSTASAARQTPSRQFPYTLHTPTR